MQPEVEREVVRMSKSGDPRSYEPLVRAYEGPGLRLAVGMLGSRQSRELHDVRDEQIEVRPAGPSSDPTRLHERSEASLILWKSLNTLVDEHREILVLKELQGFRYSEIVDILEIPEGTVASRLYHARDALREALSEMNAEYP